MRRHGLSPYVNVRGGAEAIAFYRDAFGAVELWRLVHPQDGRVGHCEMEIGDSVLMLSDEFADAGAFAPPKFGGSPVKLHLWLDDVDAVFERALALGASELRAVRDEFHGARHGQLIDPFGHIWHLSQPTRSLTPAEMQRAWEAEFDA